MSVLASPEKFDETKSRKITKLKSSSGSLPKFMKVNKEIRHDSPNKAGY